MGRSRRTRRPLRGGHPGRTGAGARGPADDVGIARERGPRCAMSPSPTIPDRLRRAFAPAERGIVGLTEQLLEAFAGADVEFERVGDKCVCRWTLGGNTRTETVPLPPP